MGSNSKGFENLADYFMTASWVPDAARHQRASLYL